MGFIPTNSNICGKQTKFFSRSCFRWCCYSSVEECIDHGESRDSWCFCSDRAERGGRQETVRQSNQIKITPFIQTPLAQSESERPTATTMHVHNNSCWPSDNQMAKRKQCTVITTEEQRLDHSTKLESCLPYCTEHIPVQCADQGLFQDSVPRRRRYIVML